MPEALLFASRDGQPLRPPYTTYGWLDAAVRRAGVPRVTAHGLRHTAASLASGASAKVVQRMLGHASAAMTLDTYAGLFDEDLDTVADAMNAAATESPCFRMCPNCAQDPLDDIEEHLEGPKYQGS